MHHKAAEIAPRVRYERKMLNETHRLRRQQQGDSSHRCIKDAILESFLLHARNLYQFLTRRRAELKSFEKSDVLAEDFFDEPSDWNPATTLDFLEENWTRLNRSLAHLTYDRVEYERTKKWVHMEKIVTELSLEWDRFLATLPKSRREWFS